MLLAEISVEAQEIVKKIKSCQRLEMGLSGDSGESICHWLQHHLEDQNETLRDPDVAMEVMMKFIEEYVYLGKLSLAAKVFRYRHMKINEENEDLCFYVFNKALLGADNQSHELCMAVFDNHIRVNPELLFNKPNKTRLHIIFSNGRSNLINGVLDSIPTTDLETEEWLEAAARSPAVHVERRLNGNSDEPRRCLISRMFHLGIGSRYYHPDNKCEELPSEDLLRMMSGDDIVELAKTNRILGPNKESDDRAKRMFFRLVMDLDNEGHEPGSADFKKKIDAAVTMIDEMPVNRKNFHWNILISHVGHATKHIEHFARAYEEKGGFSAESLVEKLSKIIDDEEDEISKDKKAEFKESLRVVKSLILARSIENNTHINTVAIQERKRVRV